MLTALLLAACSPFAPSGAMPFHVPLHAVDDWAADEACAHLTAPLQIQWFVTPGPTMASPVGDVVGLWVSRHQVYMVAEDTADEWVIRHEMLHDLTQSGDHGAAFVACGLLS